jgi:hypothetical protein
MPVKHFSLQQVPSSVVFVNAVAFFLYRYGKPAIKDQVRSSTTDLRSFTQKLLSNMVFCALLTSKLKCVTTTQEIHGITVEQAR